MGETPESFGTRLRRLRLDRNITIKEISVAIGVPPSTYREWEHDRQIKGNPYVALADKLQISLHELMTGETPDKQAALRTIERIVSDLRLLAKDIASF